MPVSFIKLADSPKIRIPTIVPTRGSTVTKIAAFPASSPTIPSVYSRYGITVHKNASPMQLGTMPMENPFMNSLTLQNGTMVMAENRNV